MAITPIARIKGTAMKGKVAKATTIEVANYVGTYPLYGFLQVGAEPVRMIERMEVYHWTDPKYEVIMPKGLLCAGLHTLECENLADVRDWASQSSQECDCAECDGDHANSKN